MKKCILPVNIFLEKKQVEVVNELKLLGCILYSKLTFNQHFKKLRATVLKIFLQLRELFFCLKNIKIQFFKTFL